LDECSILGFVLAVSEQLIGLQGVTLFCAMACWPGAQLR